jgi:hypothetical protein
VSAVIAATGRRKGTGVELVAAARTHRASTSPCTPGVVSLAKNVEVGNTVSYQLHYTRGNNKPMFFRMKISAGGEKGHCTDQMIIIVILFIA